MLKKRDKKDSTREIAPLLAAPDAVVINTDSLTINDVIEKIEKLVKESVD
jgi:cytidylate kinase